jgi:hypothetical protein
MSGAAGRLQAATASLERERAAADARRADLSATANARAALRNDTRDLIDALDTTRPQRVRAAARGDIAYQDLRDALGPPPSTDAGLAAWCGIAYRVETYRDRHGVDRATRADDAATRLLGAKPPTGGGRIEWDRVASLVGAASSILADAHAHDLSDGNTAGVGDRSTWQRTLDDVQRASATAALERCADADIGLEP